MNTALISVACTLLGAVIGYLGFYRTSKKDSKEDGKQDGTILTELGYIKGGIDDLKSEQREQRKTNTEFISRLTSVEESTKQAHKRIDRIEAERHE